MVLEIQEPVCSLPLIWPKLSCGAASRLSLTKWVKDYNNMKVQLLSYFMESFSEAIDWVLFKMHSLEVI